MNTARLTQRYCSSPVLSRQLVPDALRLLDPAQTEGPIANDEASYFLQTRTGDDDRLVADRLGGGSDPLLPFVGVLRLDLSVQQ